MEGRVLRHRLFESQYERVFVPGDGSCFFHSLALYLDLNNYCADGKVWSERAAVGHQLRRDVLRGYPTWVQDNGFEECVLSHEEALDNKIFADDGLIAFTAHALDLSIYIVKGKTETYVRHGRHRTRSPAIILAHIEDYHFEPIVPSEHFCPFAFPANIVTDLRIGPKCCVLAPDRPILKALHAKE